MKMTDDELIDAVLQAGDPFASTPEIADLDEVSISRRGLHKRLVSLAESGEISRKDVGQTTVWWVPSEGGEPISVDEVYTDGGVAQRVEGLDSRIRDLDSGIHDLDGEVERLEDAIDQVMSISEEIRQNTNYNSQKIDAEYKTAMRGAVVAGALLCFGVVFAIFEATIGLPPIFDMIGGAALVGGAGAYAYYMVQLLWRGGADA